jgi:serine/threonine protein kinase
MDEYEIVRTIHASNYSVVKLAKQDQNLYALKIIAVPEESDDEYDQVIASVEPIDDDEYDNDSSSDDDAEEENNNSGITISVEENSNRKEETDTNANKLSAEQFTNNRRFSLKQKQETMKLIQQEIMVTQHLFQQLRSHDDHEGMKYIVQINQIIEDIEMGAIVLIQEYVNGGDLFEMVSSQQIPINKVKNYFRQMCLGIKLLHLCGVAHRDIKCENGKR